MSKTVIQKARELIEEVGHDEAVKFFENRIREFGEPKSFEDICVISGWETAIEFINGKFK